MNRMFHKTIIALTVLVTFSCLLLFFTFSSHHQKRSQLQDKSKYSFVQDKFKKEFFEIISEGFSDFYSIRQENFSSQSCAHDSLNISPRLEDQPKKVQDLSKKVRILCWVMTNPDSHDLRAKHVKDTWGKRCNILYFVSSQVNESLPSIALHVNESRDILWGKTKLGFQYAYDKYKEEADWFLKADDDTYIIVENLRYMLQSYDPAEAIWFGCKYHPYVERGYMSGGAGYVLSREALNRFVETGIKDSTGEYCRQDYGGAEDVEIGLCLQEQILLKL